MAIDLKEKYSSEVKNKLKEKLEYANVHQIPQLEAIHINFGLGESASNSKVLERAIEELACISGQKPIITRAKKSIAGFKLRENAPIGIKVT